MKKNSVEGEEIFLYIVYIYIQYIIHSSYIHIVRRHL